MPRKYRPPAARRRKSKRPAPYFVEPAPAPQDGDVAASPPEDAVATIERVEAAPVAPRREAPAETSRRGAPTATKHIARDYSYVRAEVRRIVLVAGFLIISLIVTALLRN